MISKFTVSESTTIFGLSTDSKPTEGVVNGSISYASRTAYLKFLFAKADTSDDIVPSDIEKFFVSSSTPISLNRAVYSGTLRDNGNGTWTLKSKPYYASYNGESLIGPWISSIDVYAPGTTPTTGAQVVDLGGEVQTYALTAESVRTLIGQNNLFADCGNINTITFRTH